MIAQVAMSGISAFSQMGAARRDARAQYAANAANERLMQVDVGRRREENRGSYIEAVSDRIAQANEEIAMAQVMAGQRGASFSTRESIVRHLAAVEGTDIARHRRTSRSNNSALTSELRARGQQARNSNIQAYNRAKTQSRQALFGAIGSGLRIVSGHYRSEAQLAAGRNRT
jgi:hypothetical protein